MRLFFVLSSLFVLTSAVVELPFVNLNARGLFVEAAVGSPAQKVKILVTLSDECQGLTIGNKSSSNETFDPAKSSTWNKSSASDNGVSGRDDLVILDSKGNPQKLQKTAINMVNKGACNDGAKLSLTHANKNRTNSFLDSILKNETEKVVVLTYDHIPTDVMDRFTGKFTIGGRPEICSNWRTVDEAPTGSDLQWQFKVDKVSIGDFESNGTGISDLGLSTRYFKLSYGTYDQIAKELGVEYNKVPCNTNKKVVFTINGFDLQVEPKEYMDQIGDKCYFLAYNSYTNEFTLPAGVFGRYCLLLDIKNRQIGFGDRPSQQTGDWLRRQTSSKNGGYVKVYQTCAVFALLYFIVLGGF